MKFLFALLMCASLASCSWLGLGDVFRDRSNDYQRSVELAALEIPGELDGNVVGQLYPIPEGGELAAYQVSEKFSVPRPRGVALQGLDNRVKIQRLGEAVWILTSVPPAESWPRVRDFLAKQGIPTERAIATEGKIETGFFRIEEDKEDLQQFLITLSQGVQTSTTEIDVIQRSFHIDAVPDTTLNWSGTSEDLVVEDWFRKKLANALADDYDVGSASLLGRDIGAASKVEIITPDETNPYLDMRLGFDRAWGSVSYALGTDGFSVVEKSADSKFFVVDYIDPKVKPPSWLKRLFGARKLKAERFRVVLEPLDESVQVHVLDVDAKRMTQRDTYVILERVRANLT